MTTNSRVKRAVCWMSFSTIDKVFRTVGVEGSPGTLGVVGVGGGCCFGVSCVGGGGSRGISAGTGMGGGGSLGKLSGRR